MLKLNKYTMLVSLLAINGFVMSEEGVQTSEEETAEVNESNKAVNFFKHKATQIVGAALGAAAVTYFAISKNLEPFVYDIYIDSVRHYLEGSLKRSHVYNVLNNTRCDTGLTKEKLEKCLDECNCSSFKIQTDKTIYSDVLKEYWHKFESLKNDKNIREYGRLYGNVLKNKRALDKAKDTVKASKVDNPKLEKSEAEKKKALDESYEALDDFILKLTGYTKPVRA